MASLRYTLQGLINAPPDEVLGRLADLYARMGFSSLRTDAIQAWRAQLPLLCRAIGELIRERPAARGWHVLFEYGIPLRDRRPDAIILGADVIFVIEFKVGAEAHDSAARWQVHSYALDLRDFHPGCNRKMIVPILVATRASGIEFSERSLETQLRSNSFPVQECNSLNLGSCLCRFSGGDGAAPIDAEAWDAAVYSPTPTIIEAAQALFGGHRVEEISHCFSDTLETTSAAIVEAIDQSRRNNQRTICFVTGIPGSGKTLVGLNAVHSPSLLEGKH